MTCESPTKPGLPPDLPQGVPPLRSLYLYISGDCNLACRHCWISPSFQPGERGEHKLHFDHFRKAVDESLPLGLMSTKLTGGEPLLHPQFREMVSYLNERSLEIVIETNGTLIDTELAAFLHATENLSHLSISIDGAQDATHDSMRGIGGSYEAAIRGIECCVSAGIKPQIICTLHRGNINEVESLIELGLDLGCASVKLNIVQEAGRGESFDPDAHLTIDEIINLNKRIEAEYSKRHKIGIHLDIPVAFHSLKRMLRMPRGRCSALNILGVLSNGQLSLCGIGVNVPELAFGHLATDTMREVWLRSEGLQEIRRQIPEKLEGICGECIHKLDCLGACIALNYNVWRSLTGPYHFCHQAEVQGLFPDSRRRFPLERGEG